MTNRLHRRTRLKATRTLGFGSRDSWAKYRSKSCPLAGPSNIPLQRCTVMPPTLSAATPVDAVTWGWRLRNSRTP